MRRVRCERQFDAFSEAQIAVKGARVIESAFNGFIEDTKGA